MIEQLLEKLGDRTTFAMSGNNVAIDAHTLLDILNKRDERIAALKRANTSLGGNLAWRIVTAKQMAQFKEQWPLISNQ